MIKLIAQTEAINSLVLQGVNFFFLFSFSLLYFLILVSFVFWSKEQILKDTIKV